MASSGLEPRVLRLSQDAVFRSSREMAVRGLRLIENFVSEAEEVHLLEEIDAGAWVSLSKRRVQHHGYAFDYKLRGVDVRRRLGPLPAFLGPVLARMSELKEIDRDFDQLTVNEYAPGVGLSPHVDTHSMFTGVFTSLTLAGHTVMEFRRGEQRQALLLPARSLLIFSEDARYGWRHYIPHRKTDPLGDGGAPVPRPPRRVSLTFRTVRGEPCVCDFADECDTQLTAKVLSVPEVEDTYVQRMYNAIAPHFSSTRFSRWPKVVEFLETLDAGSVVADAGCGNGKYLGVRPDCTMLGSDNAIELAMVCVERGFDVVGADLLDLPYRDSSCDATVCIAVLHHISSADRRKRAIAELARVLRRGGRALVTVWALEQEAPKKTLDRWENIEGNDFFVPWHLPSHRTKEAHRSDPNAAPKATDQDQFRVYKRYYHLFEEGELTALVDSVPGARAVDTYFDKSNWCVIFEATAG